jgi:predicted secreted protein
MTIRRTLALTLAVLLVAATAALAARPKTLTYYKGTSSQINGDFTLTTNINKDIGSITFYWGCQGKDADRRAKDINPLRIVVKVSKKGKFSKTYKTKSFQIARSVTTPKSGGTDTTIKISGKFTSQKKAAGTIKATTAECTSGTVNFTATAK